MLATHHFECLAGGRLMSSGWVSVELVREIEVEDRGLLAKNLLCVCWTHFALAVALASRIQNWVGYDRSFTTASADSDPRSTACSTPDYHCSE